MISRLVSKAAVIGVAATFALAAPASAAAAPTLSGPASRTGFGTITLSGTATAGASVHLYETAIGFNDLQPAVDWENGGGVVTAKADSSGKYTIVRYLDSGFYFETEAGGVHSNKITVNMKVLPTFWVTSTTNGTLEAHTSVSPNAEGLSVTVQRQVGSTWTNAGSGKTDSVGDLVVKFTGLAAGEYTYRASVAADPQNGVLGAISEPHSTHVNGTTGPTTTPTTPPTTTPTPPTTPTTPPVPPAVGSVQFTKINYNSPGTDNGSTASLNTEWVKLTNKTKANISLNGWTVRDVANHVYQFNGPFVLKAGASMFIQTGSGVNDAVHRYWGRKGTAGYVWNNGGDTAYLRTPTNKLIDSCKWGNGPGSTTC